MLPFHLRLRTVGAALPVMPMPSTVAATPPRGTDSGHTVWGGWSRQEVTRPDVDRPGRPAIPQATHAPSEVAMRAGERTGSRRRPNTLAVLVSALASVLVLSSPVFAAEPEGVPGPLGPQALIGTVVADDTGEGIPGAVITIVELNRRTRSDQNGAFRFADVPAGEFTLGVHAASFASVHPAVRLPLSDALTIRLKPDSHFHGEITVTAMPWAVNPLETSQSVDQVDQQRIKADSNNSVGEVLERVPGVANIGTGDALGTPVVRGVSENRVRIMNDGVPLNQQQWSFRHSPNLDPVLGERVEVVRGPSSVMWGPDALGGVVNIVQGPLPSASNGESVLHGDVGLSYFDNNGQMQGDVVLEGASGGFGWRAGVVRRDTGDLETPDGSLPNTDFEQTNGVVSIGYSGSWGTARVRWNHWENDVGFYFPEGHPNVGFRLDLEDDTYAADVVLPTGAGDVTVLLSRQENLRKAFPPAAPVFPDPAVDLELVTSTARAGFSHRRVGAWKGRVAVEYRGVENDVLGPVPLVPNYEDTGYSLMALEEGRFLRARNGDYERLILSLGLRWDQSNLKVPVGEANVPEGFDQDYDSVTGSLGLVYRATERFSLAANVGRGWRPPNAFELFAFGDHVGVGAFQLGNPDLQAETALSAELSARYQSRHWRAVVTGFRSDYSDFIYLVELTEDEVDQELGAGWTQRPVFFYRQTDAVIDGLEASVSVVPLEQLELGLVYSSVSTKNDSTGTGLPQTPPDRVKVYVRATRPQLGRLVSPFVELETVWVDDGVPSGPDEVFSGRPFGAATDSYTLLHLKAGLQVPIGQTSLGVNLAIQNLLDEEYTDFLYPYKGLPYQGAPVLNAGRDIRLMTRCRF